MNVCVHWSLSNLKRSTRREEMRRVKTWRGRNIPVQCFHFNLLLIYEACYFSDVVNFCWNQSILDRRGLSHSTAKENTFLELDATWNINTCFFLKKKNIV